MKRKKCHLACVSYINCISGQREVDEVKFFVREFQLMNAERIVELESSMRKQHVVTYNVIVDVEPILHRSQGH